MPFLVWAQSVADLEKQLLEATAPGEKIALQTQLANQLIASDNKKAMTYAKQAFTLARESGNRIQTAATSYLIAQIAEKQGDEPNMRNWLKYAVQYAKEANDLDMLARAAEKYSTYYAKKREYDDAFRITKDAFSFVAQKGLKVGDLENQYAAQRAALEREKRQLEQQINQVQGRLADLSAEKNQLNNEKTNLEVKQQELVKAKEKVEAEVTKKAEDLVEASKARETAEIAVKERESEVKKLSRDVLANKLALEEQKNALMHQELLVKEQQQIAVERDKFLQMILAVACVLLLLTILLYGRFQSKKRLAKSLEDKNKIIAQEQARSDGLLLNILPKRIAEELKNQGKAQARRFDQVTVLFSDFVNFTHIAEQLSPEELVEELDKCFKAFDYIIKQYPDIEKIKTIGDAYMCVTGLSERKAMPYNQVQSALDMQSYLNEYKQLRIRQGKPFFEARIGLHTGPVVAGVVGDVKFAYDIWGDTVNLASRIESNSEPGRVNISQDTYNLIRYRFACNYRGRMPAKNKGELDMYFVEKSLTGATVVAD
jgi:class 3 adenylate cyclase